MQEVDSLCQRAAFYSTLVSSRKRVHYFLVAICFMPFNLTLSSSDSYGKIKIGFAHIEAVCTGAVSKREALCRCLDGGSMVSFEVVSSPLDDLCIDVWISVMII